jgi:hypothetical protein
MSAIPPLLSGESTTNFSCVNKNMRVYNDLLVDGILTVQSSGNLIVESDAIINRLTVGTLSVVSGSSLSTITLSGLVVTGTSVLGVATASNLVVATNATLNVLTSNVSTAGNLVVATNSTLNFVTASGLAVKSSVLLTSTGTGLSLNEAGSGPKQGTGTLVAGTKGITNSGITASSRIFLTTQTGTPAGSIGALYIAGKSVGNSFTVASSAAADASTFAFEIFEPYV